MPKLNVGQTNANIITAFEAALAAPRNDIAQSFTDAQKAQVRTNIGAGSASDTTNLQTRMDDAENELNVLDARMDEFASLPDGSTAGDAELLDIRVGYNGKTWPSAGDAVRGQVADLKTTMNDTITVDWWNVVYGLPVLEGIALNGTTQAQSASQFSIDGYIEVEASKEYYAYCDGNSAYPTVGARFVNFFDSSKQLLSTLNSGSNNTRTFTTPPTCKYITITFTYSSGQKGTYYLTNKAESERINYYNTHNNVMHGADVEGFSDLAHTVDNWNIVADCSDYQLEKGKYYNGTTVGTGSFFSVLQIPVKPDTTYYAECTPNPNYQNAFARFLNYYDSTNTLISTVGYPVGVFHTPYNAHYISVSLVNANKTADTIALSDFTWYITEDYTKTTKLSFNTKVNPHSVFGLDDIQKEVARLPLLRAEHRIATINFQFDDGSVKDADIVDIFDAYGLTCGFSLISNITPTRVQEYLGYQAKNYEILSHSTDTTGMNDTSVAASVIEGKLKASKATLLSYGFNVRGWVTPYSVMANTFVPLVQKYYDYGTTISYGQYDGTGTPYQTANEETCKMFRVSLQSTTLANQKKAVDEAIAHNGFLTFYGHAADLDGSDYETTSNLNELLAYVQTKMQDLQCYCLKPSDAVDYYFHVRHSDYIELLNA